jgi:hypothetical protein
MLAILGKEKKREEKKRKEEKRQQGIRSMCVQSTGNLQAIPPHHA